MSLEKLYRDHGIPFADEGERHYKEGWLNTSCTFCNKTDGNHLGFNTEGNYFFCWVCGYHSIRETIAALLRVSEPEAQRIATNYKVTKSGTFFKKESSAKHIRLNKFPFKYPTNTVDLNKVHKRYLSGRGFDPDELINDWDLQATSPNSILKVGDKVIKYAYRILIPFKWNDEIVTYQCRDYTNKQDPKYMACPIDREKVHHQNILYGDQSKWKETGLIVEGVFDAWRFRGRAAATLGMQLTDEQVRVMVKSFKRVFIIFDPGRKEKAEAIKLQKRLEAFGIECNLILDLDTDPGAMKQEDADHLLKDLKVW
jgi:hypothetical protein